MRTLMMKTLMRKMIGLVSSQKGEENFSILTTMMNKFKFYFFNCYYILTTCEYIKYTEYIYIVQKLNA